MEAVYKANDYRQAIKNTVLNRKELLGRTLSFQKMADHCRVQKTYLSKVLNRGGNLTRDQLYLACDYLQLSENETDFLLTLHELDGSMVPARQKKLRDKIEKIRAQHLKSEAHINSPVVAPSSRDLQTYYLDPLVQVVHIFLTVTKYAREPKLIAKSLGVSELLVAQKIKILEKLNIVQESEVGYKVLDNDFHLSADSEIYGAYRKLIRLLSLKKLDELDNEKSYSFSVIFSSSPEARKEIQEQFLLFLNRVKKIVSNSQEKEVYQLNFDLFDWT